MAHHTNPVVDS